MVDIDVLVKYLKDGKEKGFNVEQLKDSLIKQGYSLDDINKAIGAFEGEVEVKPEIKAEIPKRHNILVFIIGGILLLILIGVLIFMNVEKEIVKEGMKEEFLTPELPPLPSGEIPIQINEIPREISKELPPLPSGENFSSQEIKEINFTELPKLPPIPSG